MNKGDTVICIDNKPNGSGYIMMDVPLTIGKSYIVQQGIKSETIRILNDENIFKDFRKSRFVTQSEWLQRQRHNKLNELGI
jgi:hypothetical protein